MLLCQYEIDSIGHRNGGFRRNTNSLTQSVDVNTNFEAARNNNFKIYNVNHLKILVEWKKEIISLIKPLQRAKQIIFSSHSIFKDYVTEKLFNSDSNFSHMMSPTKKKVEIITIRNKIE